MQEYNDLSKDFNDALKSHEEKIQKARDNREFFKMVEEVSVNTPTYKKVEKQSAVTRKSNDETKKKMLKADAISVIATLAVTGYISFEVKRQQNWDDYREDISSKIEQMQEDISDKTQEDQKVYWTAFDENINSNSKGVR